LDTSGAAGINLAIGRVRILLSLVVLALIYIDPNTGGWFSISRSQLIVLLAHLTYSLASCLAIKNGWIPTYILRATTALDAAFAMSLALVTEGTSSPSFVFFVFAVIAAVRRSSLPLALAVTSFSIGAYVLAIAFGLHETNAGYMSKAGYLAITAGLVGYFGLRRGDVKLSGQPEFKEPRTLDSDVREDYVQMLASVNLWLQACQGMLRSGEADATLAQLSDLQISITREYDQVRGLLLNGRDSAVPSSSEL
jgi:hypothetical protein